MLKILAEADLKVLNDIRHQTQVIENSLATLRISLKANMRLAQTKKNEGNSLTGIIAKKKVLLEEIRNDQKSQEELIRKHHEDLHQVQAEYEKRETIQSGTCRAC